MKFIIIVTTLILCACTPVYSGANTAENVEVRQRDELPHGLRVWTDPKTGCEYFVPYGNSEYGLMPRTSSDGFHQVCGGQPG
jgi:hypothetical protein